LKTVWLHIVRAYVGLGLFFYYKKIKVVREQNIPKNKPILFVSNHQNALLDALLIGVTSGRFSYFLTRASVFKKPLVAKLLSGVNMLPVYRVRDGWSTISKNNSTFKTCTDKFKMNQAVALFPEGNHNLNRTVRPLSKGFVRIVFETLSTYPELDLQVVPIGLNYREATVFGDSVALYYGKPIPVKLFVSEFSNEEINVIKKTVQSKIKGLTTHVDPTRYDETIAKLNALNVDYLNPKSVNRCLKTNFEDCESKPKQTVNWIKQVFKVLLILNLFMPFVIWKYAIKPKIKELEFIGTFRFALVLTIVPFWILLLSVIVALNFGMLFGVAYLFSTLFIGLLSVKL